MTERKDTLQTQNGVIMFVGSSRLDLTIVLDFTLVVVVNVH